MSEEILNAKHARTALSEGALENGAPSRESPCISVVIPVYNCEELLIETLESVLTQDLRDIEVVCVDDGSTDRSAYVIEQFSAFDPRVRLIRQKQAGAGAARNAGIDAARGKFITFLDSDDLYEEASYLSALYEGAVEHNQLAAGGCMVNWRGDDYERDFQNTEYDGYQFLKCGVVTWEDYQFDFGFTRFIFARELFAGGANRFGTLRYYEDPLFFVRILSQAGSFYATDKAHYLYRLQRKRHGWTTGQVLDFIEGASQNLAFSRERGLALLHWYTVQHMEFNVWEIGVSANPALALDVVDAKLRACEALIDQQLLEQAGETDLPYTLRLRAALDTAKGFNPVGKSYLWLRYKLAHR